MGSLRDLLDNYVLIVAILCWVTAQVLKTLFVLISSKELKLERLTGAGGMPSAHSASVCGLTLAVAKTAGMNSPEFAIAFLFAVVVMYDAMGVRRAAGEQAKVLNGMVRKRQEEPLSSGKISLKESLGHTPLEVVAGALLGILIAILVPM